ncbi:MAG: hypothetical protein ABIK92_13345 [Pseudomonadota bacterium]
MSLYVKSGYIPWYIVFLVSVESEIFPITERLYRIQGEKRIKKPNIKGKVKRNEALKLVWQINNPIGNTIKYCKVGLVNVAHAKTIPVINARTILFFECVSIKSQIESAIRKVNKVSLSI